MEATVSAHVKKILPPCELHWAVFIEATEFEKKKKK